MNIEKKKMDNNRVSENMSQLLRRAVMFTCLPLLLILAACATTATPEKNVAVERAEARWEALLADDLETVYSYYSPGYRSTTSLIDFGVSQRTRRVLWTSAEYREHSCSESRCIISFDAGFKVIRPVPGVKTFDHNSLIEETWVKTAGEWWYLPENQ